MQRSEIAIAATDGSVPARAAHPIPEVAKLLGGVTERYVWMLIDSGDLPSFKLGKRRLVRRSDIDTFINELAADDIRARAAATAAQ